MSFKQRKVLIMLDKLKTKYGGSVRVQPIVRLEPMTKIKTRNSLILLMKSYKYSNDEIIIEAANYSDWFNCCSNAKKETLQSYVSTIKEMLKRAIQSNDESGYVQCRNIFLKTAEYFLIKC